MKELEKITDEATKDFILDFILEEIETLKKNQAPNKNTDILDHLYKIRVGQLEIKEKHQIFDNFLSKSWKLIFTLVALASVISYTIAVYHHESTLKPFIFDIAKTFLKLGGQ